MRRYPPIADHGMIGDLQTVALVSSDGAIDWFCTPRFDSPSVFAAVLDHDRGGAFRIAADHPDARITQLYLPDDDNDEDVIFNEELLIDVADRDPGEIIGTFNFVLVTG